MSLQNDECHSQNSENGKQKEGVVYLCDAPIYGAKEHDVKFDPDEYLKGFYISHREDEAMTVVLFFLPGILYRLGSETVETLLDLGAGPTVYVPICVRNRAKHVYTSDYSKFNRERLREFIRDGETKFDWSNICNWIASIEAVDDTPKEMLRQARSKMRGVFEVNVQCEEVIRSVDFYTGPADIPPPRQFDCVVTIFCLEYSCETLDDYRRAVRGATRLIKPGGYLIYGGIMNATEYGFAGRRFKCHYLKKEELFDTLKSNSMSIEEGSPSFHFIAHDDVYLLISQRLA